MLHTPLDAVQRTMRAREPIELMFSRAAPSVVVLLISTAAFAPNPRTNASDSKIARDALEGAGGCLPRDAEGAADPRGHSPRGRIRWTRSTTSAQIVDVAIR